MYDVSSNVQLGGELLKTHYPNISGLRGVEHSIFLFLNDFSKIPAVNQIIKSHKAIYNLFGSGICHKPHSIFKPEYYEFHNMNIGLFSGDDTSMDGYFIVMHRDMGMRKSLFPKFLLQNSTLCHSTQKFPK